MWNSFVLRNMMQWYLKKQDFITNCIDTHIRTVLNQYKSVFIKSSLFFAIKILSHCFRINSINTAIKETTKKPFLIKTTAFKQIAWLCPDDNAWLFTCYTVHLGVLNAKRKSDFQITKVVAGIRKSKPLLPPPKKNKQTKKSITKWIWDFSTKDGHS